MNDGSLTATCIGLITDKPDRGCIEKARAASLPHRTIDVDPKNDRETFDRKVQEAVESLAEEKSVDAGEVILAEMGWMWIHTPWFIEKHEGKILNVHPALLPKHGGKGMYGHHVHDSVLKSGDTESGMTIHVMDSEVDTGKILLQKTCSVLPDDDTGTLQERVQELEKEWYPKLLQMIEDGEIII